MAEKYKVPKLKTEWITSGITSEMVKWAEDFATYLVSENLWDTDKKKLKNEKGWDIKVEPLTTSQLRRFFGEIKRIQTSGFEIETSSILMLKPKLAYAVGRAERDSKIGEFYQQLAIGLDTINTDDKKKGKIEFDNFVKITEAIVAYHKAKGGK